MNHLGAGPGLGPLARDSRAVGRTVRTFVSDLDATSLALTAFEDMISEYRVYVVEGEIRAVCHYKGPSRGDGAIDELVVEDAVRSLARTFHCCELFERAPAFDRADFEDIT